MTQLTHSRFGRWMGQPVRSLAAVLVLVSCTPMDPKTLPEPPESQEPDWACLRDQGCPQHSSIPLCPEGLEAMSIEEAWARVGSTPGGSRVSIRGPLGAFYGGICTLMNCPERGCCNKCITLYGLGSEAALREHRYEETIQLKGPRIGCTGDESLQCCEFEASGQEVIAQGTVQKPDTNRYSLEDATICVPSSP